MDELQAEEVLRLPFVFVPHGAEAPAAWRAAHPDVVSLPTRLVVRGGVQRVQFAVPAPPPMPPATKLPSWQRDPAIGLGRWLKERLGWILDARPDDPGKAPEPRTQRPVDAPPGTRPIDEAGLPDGAVHEIKEELQAGATDWIGVAPNGDVIRPDETGRSENLGSWRGLTNRGDGGGWRQEHRARGKPRGRGRQRDRDDDGR